MTCNDRYDFVLTRLSADNPNPATELHYADPFSLLVAVMLSAQCTDKRVNLVTPGLLNAFPTPAAMAAADEADILSHIASVSYPNAKARHLRQMSAMLVEHFGGIVPDTLEALTALPGVGRKTANVVLGQAFGQATIPVDTHVFRVARRIGLSRGDTPEKVERDLTRHIPGNLRFKAHHWILLHGRYTCKAQRPLCDSCALQSACKTFKAARKGAASK